MKGEESDRSSDSRRGRRLTCGWRGDRTVSLGMQKAMRGRERNRPAQRARPVLNKLLRLLGQNAPLNRQPLPTVDSVRLRSHGQHAVNRDLRHDVRPSPNPSRGGRRHAPRLIDSSKANEWQSHRSPPQCWRGCSARPSDLWDAKSTVRLLVGRFQLERDGEVIGEPEGQGRQRAAHRQEIHPRFEEPSAHIPPPSTGDGIDC